MTQNSNKINFWRGTRFVFERKIQRNELIVGTVYFVGNSMEDVEGTGQSTYGVIYQAVSENRAVRYGIFATDDDITKLIEELTEKIDEESEERREADDQLSERIAHLIPEVADAVENHMAIFDSDGRLKDSGRDIVEFLMDGDIDDATIKFENGKLVVQDYSHKHHISDVDGLRGELDTKIGTEKMGTSNGIATLDENAKVNLEQMPYTDGYGIDITSAGEIKTEPISDAEIDAMNAGERNGHLLDNLGLVRLWNRIVSFFVQKEDGKGLSSNDYTTAEKNKLAGIEQGAEVNVQSDWNQTDSTKDDFIKNKPSVYTKTEIDQMLAAGMHYEVVSSLPSTGEAGTLYLVPSSTSVTNDVYDEYIWLPTEGQVSAHFEKIGTTKADLANYYTKSEVDTALGNKQASITITNNTSTPADNDTVIMQASGTTNTTTFLRRTMSKIWDYIKGKADSVYFGYGKTYYVNNDLIDYKNKIVRFDSDNIFYAIQYKNNVQWTTRDALTDEILNTYTNVNGLFDGERNYGRNHPYNGVYDEILIGNGTKVVIDRDSNLIITFNQQVTLQLPLSVVSIMAGVTIDTAEWEDLNVSRVTFSTNRYYDTCILPSKKIWYIRIKNYGINSSSKLQGPSGIECYRNVTGLPYSDYGYSCVTKYPVKQDLYGEVEAPKFTMRGGTASQVLLANGTTLSLPVPVNNGGTGATDAKNARYNLITNIQTEQSALSDSTQLLFKYITPTTNNGAIYYRALSSLWTYIKGKADLIYSTITETNKKANRVIDHTWNQPSYSASASGTHVKICDIPADCVCIMNVRKSVYGYPSINTLWIGNNNSLDFKSLTETDIVATVSSRICTLSVPAHTSSGTPLHTYDFEISVLNKENLSAITWYDDATYYSPSRPTKPNIVMQQSAPVTDGSLAFNVNSSTHVASVSVDGYTDFVGMLTEDSESAVLVKLSDEAEGSVYRFTFDHAIEGGVSFSNSNASTVYCEVSQDIHAGDTITLTAVSNTADGWIASVSSAGIISSDNSVGIEWENGVADLSVPVLPPNVVLNRSEVEWENDRTLSIGQGAQAQSYSGDESNPYAYTEIGKLSQFKVDGGSNEYYHAVTAGTTYSINRSGTVVSYTPSVSGYVIICSLSGFSSTRYDFSDDNHKWAIETGSTVVSSVIRDAVISGSNKYILGVITASSSSISQFSAQSTVRYWTKHNTIQAMNIAICAYATGINTIAIGSSSYGSNSITIGKNSAESNRNCIVMGYSAKASAESALLIGHNAKTTASDVVAIGNNSGVGGSYSMAIGQSAKVPSVTYALAIGNSASANGGFSVAIGAQAKTTDSNSIAIGVYSNANKGIAIGRNSNAAYASGDSNLPYYKAKRFTAVEFTVGGEARLVIRGTYGENVTISVNGTQKTVTPPSSSQLMLCVVNDSSAGVMGKFVSDYPKADGKVAYCPNMQASSVSGDNITGNYYAVWFRCDNNQSYIDALVNASTFSFLAYYKTNATSSENFAIGYDSYALCNGIAIGRGAVAIRDSQVVIGNYSVADDDAQLIIGSGISGNQRKNIFTIDSKDRVHARAYISDPQTYDNGGNSVNLGTITMGILKVTGGGSITFTNQNAVEGHCVKVYASGSDITCNGDTITAGKWREYLFLDGAWRSKM